jgi:hypothetical protein
MAARRLVCIESELLQCERELCGLLGDARGVLQSMDTLPDADEPSVEHEVGADVMIPEWNQIVSFFEQLPSFVDADTMLDASEKQCFKILNLRGSISTNPLVWSRKSLTLRYGSDAYVLSLRSDGISGRPYNLNMHGSLTQRNGGRDHWRWLTSIQDVCGDYSGDISVLHVVKQILIASGLWRSDSSLEKRLVARFPV